MEELKKYVLDKEHVMHAPWYVCFLILYLNLNGYVNTDCFYKYVGGCYVMMLMLLVMSGFNGLKFQIEYIQTFNSYMA